MYVIGSRPLINKEHLPSYGFWGVTKHCFVTPKRHQLEIVEQGAPKTALALYWQRFIKWTKAGVGDLVCGRARDVFENAERLMRYHG